MSKLLVIEDDADLRTTLVGVLGDEGYSVDSAPDGGQGLQQLLNVDYDGVVLDLRLPVLDGFAVLAEFRKQSQTPVLMLTAKDGLSDRVAGLDAGADDYLTKPFELEELVARLRAMLRRSGFSNEPELRADDVLIKTATREVFRSGALVELTAREYDFAELMVSNRGRVISRGHIYESLFDENDDGVANTLDVYVYKLRQKLGKDFVQTRRGHGYMTP